MQDPGCRRIAQVAHDIDVEEVFKGPALEGPRFQMSHVHAVIEEVAQDVIQGAWPVLCRQDRVILSASGDCSISAAMMKNRV